MFACIVVRICAPDRGGEGGTLASAILLHGADVIN